MVKATDTKSSAHQTQQTQTQGQQPFFNKEGANALLSESAPAQEAPLPFFVQRKLTVGPVDDPLEREADSMADQVVQRLAQPAHEQTLQRQAVSPQISPVSTIQPAHIATPAGTEGLQMKEETEKLDMEEVPIQRKPIFDSMADDTLQRKCAVCGKEETLQRKEEPEKLETIDMPIQRKCAECEKEEKLQRQETPGADTATPAAASESTTETTSGADGNGATQSPSTSDATTPADGGSAATQPQAAATDAPVTPGTTGLSFNLEGPLAIDWKAMSQPFHNRGAEHLRGDSAGAVQQRWLQTFQLMRDLGLKQDWAATAANKLTPMAVDNALKGDFPTRSEQIDRDLGSAPVGGSFSIQFKREAHHVQRVADPLQRKCAHCEQEEKKVQRQEKQSSAPSKMDNIEQRLSSSGGKGSSMPAPVRTEMESAFGTDFSNVRIHTNSEAVGLNNDLQAQAFTHGSDIYFNEGKYNPGSTDGKRLLAHELTHTIQQGAVSSGTVQQKPEKATATRVQRLSWGDVWDATGGAVGRGLSAAGNAIAETAGDVVEWGAEKLEGLVESIAPGLLTFLRGDIIGNIKNRLVSAIDTLTGGLFSRVQTEGLAAILQDLFGSAIQRIGGGVASTCSALADMAGRLWAFVKKLTGPALTAFKNMMQRVGNFFSTIWNDFALPAWEGIKKYAGAAWDWIVEKANWLWDLTAPVRNAIGRAWNWVKTQFGIAWSNGVSVLEWLKNKAAQAWDWVKSAIEPIMGPLKVIGAILLLLSPAGPIILIYKGAPHIWNAIKWLAENFNKHVIVRARNYLRNTVIPAIQSAVTTLNGLITSGINWVKGLFDGLMNGITAALNALAGLSLFRFLAGIIRRIVGGIRTALQRVSGMLSSLANSLVSIATRVWNFIRPFAELLRQLALVGVLGPFAILDDGVWSTLNKIVNFGLEIPCVRELEGLLHVPWILAQLDKFRKMMKGVYEIIKNPQPIIDEIRLSIGNMITQIAPRARAAIEFMLGPRRAHHLEGIMRHLEPKLTYLAANWWEVVKQTGWDMLWPWPAFAHECGEIWDKGKSMFSNFFRFEFSKGIDDGLAIFRLLNALAGHLYGWFAIASVLVGTIIGAFFGGAGAVPGFWAGVAVAVEVGEVLMITMLAAEGASIQKAVFDLSAGSQTEEQNEEDYEQIASSGLNLGIMGAMVVLGELAVKFGKTVLQQVKGLFRRRGAVPEVAPPGVRGEAPRVESEAPRVDAEPPPMERPGGRTAEPETPGTRTPEPDGPTPEPQRSGPETPDGVEPGPTPEPVAEGPKVRSESGHEVGIAEDGSIIRCSICAKMKQRYEVELNNPRNAELKQRLEQIEAMPNGPEKTQRAAELEADIARVRETGEVSHKRWDDPDLTLEEMIQDYREVYKDSPLSDLDIQAYFDEGYRVNPRTNRFKRPIEEVAPTGTRTDLPAPGTREYIDWMDYFFGKTSKPPCFTGNTPVRTPGGSVKIKDLAAGDKVLAYDFQNRQTVTSTVLSTSRNWTDMIVKIQVNHEEIEATLSHPFWVESEHRWLTASALQPGMILRLANGGEGLVTATATYLTKEDTYNLEVDVHHNYFVGEEGVLVHNDVPASIFSSTSTFSSDIYVIRDIHTGKAIYVGQSIQTTEVRIRQHLTDPHSALFEYLKARGIDPLAEGFRFREHISIENPIRGRQLTPYELSVWEQYYIDLHRQGGSLQNRINAITEEKFLRYRQLHNPCR